MKTDDRCTERPVYLDHNATTPVLPEVVDAMLPFLGEHFGNPSSGHVYGRHARDAVSVSRRRVASFLGCDDDEVFFTSGGTEANNLAIRGVAEAVSGRRHVVTTVIEHPATANPCRWLERRGWRVTRAGVDSFGQTRVAHVREAVGADTALVSVMHANNETGVLQPVGELVELAHAVGALVHTDAAQSLGKVRLQVRQLGVDLLSAAGHKMYGPKGVGVLYVKRGTAVRPLALGADHERGLRPGTENVAGIVGFGVACEAAQRDLSEASNRMQRLRDQLFAALTKNVAGLELNGAPDRRLPNTLNVRFPRVLGSVLLAGAPEIAASTGSACHDGHEAASAVILAMGVDPAEAVGSVRLTLGRDTTEADIEIAAAALARSWRSLTSVE